MAAAEDAGKAAADALKAATDNISEFRTIPARGESSVAEMNGRGNPGRQSLDVDDVVGTVTIDGVDERDDRHGPGGRCHDHRRLQTNPILIADPRKIRIVHAKEQIEAPEVVRERGTIARSPTTAVTGVEEVVSRSHHSTSKRPMVAVEIGGEIRPDNGEEADGPQELRGTPYRHRR